MIICFSGTGNSLYVARQLSERLGEPLFKIVDDAAVNPETTTIDCAKSSRVVWVFPVHSWGVPNVVKRFISQVTLSNAMGLAHHLVVTCGDDAGLTAKQWRKLISKRGWTSMGAHSVIMPNSYTLMKGFDVDSLELTMEKLEAAPKSILSIADDIIADKTSDRTIHGAFAWIKSAIIYPWFMRYATSPKPFHADDRCTNCGRCAKLCPMGNIAMWGPKPHWAENCAMCLRCYHVCPNHAIGYGSKTVNKGQYVNPDL